AIDDAVRQAQQLASGFNSKLGPVYSVRYHVSNYQPTPVMRMMKAEAAAPASAQDTYDQQTIQFDDQVDVVFELEPSQAQSGTANQNGSGSQGTAPAATNAPSQQ
ncbi:SIMPL domain-containing protein, partial [Cronobacter sakazakii]